MNILIVLCWKQNSEKLIRQTKCTLDIVYNKKYVDIEFSQCHFKKMVFPRHADGSVVKSQIIVPSGLIRLSSILLCWFKCLFFCQYNQYCFLTVTLLHSLKFDTSGTSSIFLFWFQINLVLFSSKVCKKYWCLHKSVVHCYYMI